MLNIKLEEKSYKLSFKALRVKIQQSKNRQGDAHRAPHPGADRVNKKKEEMTLRHFSWNGCREEKYALSITRILLIQTTTEKIELTG